MITHRVVVAYNEYVKDGKKDKVTARGLGGVLPDWTASEVQTLTDLVNANHGDEEMTVGECFRRAFGVELNDHERGVGSAKDMMVATPCGWMCADAIGAARAFLDHHRMAFANRDILRSAVMRACEDIVLCYVYG